MKVIVGLGNPGEEYRDTRHNVGFMILDNLLEQNGGVFQKGVHQNKICKVLIDHFNVLLVKPQTFMNLSGQGVSAILKYYKVPIDDLIVVHDEVDLPLGQLRFMRNGSSGGHNGIKSVIECLGDENFFRLRCGIGRAQTRAQMINYVLSNFKADEKEAARKLVDDASEALRDYLGSGITIAMNRFNRK